MLSFCKKCCTDSWKKEKGCILFGKSLEQILGKRKRDAAFCKNCCNTSMKNKRHVAFLQKLLHRFLENKKPCCLFAKMLQQILGKEKSIQTFSYLVQGNVPHFPPTKVNPQTLDYFPSDNIAEAGLKLSVQAEEGGGRLPPIPVISTPPIPHTLPHSANKREVCWSCTD